MLAAILATPLAGTALALPSKPQPVFSSLTVSKTVGLAGDRLSATVSGRITCTKYAHYHLNLWLLQSARGALGKGSAPPKTAPSSAATLCRGTNQAWSLTAVDSGTHPRPFASGAATVCLTATLSLGGRYTDLKQVCAPVVVG